LNEPSPAQGHAIREVIMIHQGAPERALVFYLINTPLPESGLFACISSRITTGIHVARYYQINDN
jgi:hypothetical protein